MSTFINDIIDDNKWEYLKVNGTTLTPDYFKDKEIVIFKKSTLPTRMHLKNAPRCIFYFGKIKNEEVYFYIIDDSNYDCPCCDTVELFYSESIDIVKEKMEKDLGSNFELPN